MRMDSRLKKRGIMLTCILIILGWSAPTFAEQVELKLGTSALGSAGYSEVMVLAATITKRLGKEGIKAVSIPTPSSTASLRILGNGEIDCGMSSYRDFRHVWFGTGPFAKNTPSLKPMHGLWKPTSSFIYVTLKKRNDINSLKDLVGKKVYPYIGGVMEHGIEALDCALSVRQMRLD